MPRSAVNPHYKYMQTVGKTSMLNYTPREWIIETLGNESVQKKLVQALKWGSMYLSPEDGHQASKQNAPKVKYCKAETKKQQESVVA